LLAHGGRLQNHPFWGDISAVDFPRVHNFERQANGIDVPTAPARHDRVDCRPLRRRQIDTQSGPRPREPREVNFGISR
jgi:hypothetical protein